MGHNKEEFGDAPQALRLDYIVSRLQGNGTEGKQYVGTKFRKKC